MAFQHKIPEWKNEGVQPPDDLIENGYQVKQKPPAAFFNWFWSKVTKAIKELQDTFSSHTHEAQSLEMSEGSGTTVGDVVENLQHDLDNKLDKDIGNLENPISVSNGGTGKATELEAFDTLAFRKSIKDDSLVHCNTLTGIGIYRVYITNESTASSYNFPARYGVITVNCVTGYISQVFYDVSEFKHYVRYTSNGGSTWSTWKQSYDTTNKPLLTDLSGTLPVTNGGTGATTTGKARENLSLNLLTFVGFKQINVTTGEETIDGIVEAMPICSELICDIGASNAKIYPNSYGVLRVIKTNNTRTLFYFYLKGNNVYYFGNYDSSLSEPWQGWATVYNSDNLPVPAYNHQTFELSTEDLNTLKTTGYYVAAGNNTCTNSPLPTGTSFGLEVSRTAGTHYTQVLHSVNNGMYIRYYDGSTWQEWYRVHTKHNLPRAGQVQFGSYTGTGTDGSANPCRLEFDFQPKFVIVERCYDGALYRAEFVYGVSETPLTRFKDTDNISTLFSMAMLPTTWSGNSLEWYYEGENANVDYSLTQLNGAITYRYIAIG